MRAELVKGQIERIHIQYLCDHFNILPGQLLKGFNLNGSRPDLFIPQKNGKPPIVFELKTRNFPTKPQNIKSRPISDYRWWRLDKEQIGRYEYLEKTHGMTLYWIFLLGISK